MSGSTVSNASNGAPGEPKHKGTLVCVVLKARNLPNKRSIGKQDPYCVLQQGTEQQKTKPDKRGGQHPHWDEQLHFEIYEDVEEQLNREAAAAAAAAAQQASTSSVSSLSKASASAATGTAAAGAKLPRKPGKGKTLRVSCYADDTKEPEFIGEGSVDLTETLQTGEFDEWVVIKARDRYAGEVYLELTFYSSAAPPRKKAPIKPRIPANTTYGGAGTFSGEDSYDGVPRIPAKQVAYTPIPSSFMVPGLPSSTSAASHLTHHNRNSNASTVAQSISHKPNLSTITSSSTTQIPEEVPPSLRPSSSLAYLESYTPPYAVQSAQRGTSPAPPPGHDPPERRGSFTQPPEGPPASAQIYGHRLPDAAPASVTSQRLNQLAGPSYTPSPSNRYSQLSQSSSVATVRPPHTEADGAALDDLVGPMSSMSMQNMSTSSGSSPPGTVKGYAHYPPPMQSAQYSGPAQPVPPPPPSQYSGGQSIDQFGRPTGSFNYGSTSHLSAYGGDTPHTMTAPTPPVHPNSAPPDAHYHSSSAASSIGNLQVRPQAQHATSYQDMTRYGGPPQPPPHHQGEVRPDRGTSPAPPLPPPRGHTPNLYHALPQPPPGRPLPTTSPGPGFSNDAYGSPYHQAQQPLPPPPSGVLSANSQQQQYQHEPQPPPRAPSQNGYRPSVPAGTTFIPSPYANASSPAPHSNDEYWQGSASAPPSSDVGYASGPNNSAYATAPPRTGNGVQGSQPPPPPPPPPPSSAYSHFQGNGQGQYGSQGVGDPPQEYNHSYAYPHQPQQNMFNEAGQHGQPPPPPPPSSVSGPYPLQQQHQEQQAQYQQYQQPQHVQQTQQRPYGGYPQATHGDYTQHAAPPHHYLASYYQHQQQ